MSTAGVDLGTGRVKAARFDETGNPQVLRFNGEDFLPSVVCFDQAGRRIVGTDAENQMLIEPQLGVMDWKRYMGTDSTLFRDEAGREYKAVDVEAILLEEVKTAYANATGSVLCKVVLTVPANYNDRQKEETRRAAEMAGLEVIRLGHEPTAGLVGNDVHRRGDGRYAAIDLGHGTFDCSICNCEGNSIDIRTTSGIPKCGGTDFNKALLDHVNLEFQKKHGFMIDAAAHGVAYQELHQRVVHAKHSLASRDSVTVVCSANGKVLSVPITRATFADLTATLVDQVIACVAQSLTECSLTPADIREFIPVGGGTLVPSLGEAFERHFGKPLTTHSDVHFCVAKGALMMARMELEAQGESVTVNGRRLPPVNLSTRDVTAHPIGVAAKNGDGEHVLKNSVILKKGVPMPSTKKDDFQLESPGQTEAHIRILQGPNGAAEHECLLLGHFDLKGLQPVFDKPHKIEIKLSINADGVLAASAYDPLDGTTADMTVDYKKATASV